MINHFRKTILFPFSKGNNESLQGFSFLPYFQNNTYAYSTNNKYLRRISKFENLRFDEINLIIYDKVYLFSEKEKEENESY